LPPLPLPQQPAATVCTVVVVAPAAAKKM